MYAFIAVLFIGFLVLVVSELVRRRFHVSNEDSRKTYHIVHAIIVGLAPFFIPYSYLIALELLLLVVMVVVRHYHLFPWLHQVGRLSWGEYFGIAGVVLIAAMQPNPWVFLAAMLHLGIADALAALVGTRYGKNYQFKVFGQTKSVPGSLAFYFSSLIITTLLVIAYQSGADSLLLVLLLPPLATLAELASPFGTDNFVVPVLVVVVLNGLKFAS